MIKRFVIGCLMGVSLWLTSLAAIGWFDGLGKAPDLAVRADQLIEDGFGGDGLGPRFDWLITVQDPGFWDHSGIDLRTPGAGITTVTQSLSKRVGFEDFKPGIAKLRQSAFAIALDQELSKQQILALFLDTVEMGRSDQGWTVGFYAASEAFFALTPAEISDDQFVELVSVMISPSALTVGTDATAERIRRIKRLLAGECAPDGLMDVWLKACA